jgi:hypothetical protein
VQKLAAVASRRVARGQQLVVQRGPVKRYCRQMVVAVPASGLSVQHSVAAAAAGQQLAGLVLSIGQGLVQHRGRHRVRVAASGAAEKRSQPVMVLAA